MEAQPHPRQAERLRELYSYEILDTDREVEFDEIVKLAAAVCGTAISVVNLIDAERQWFKAEVGLGVRETPLATSLCSHAILESEFVEIPDTLQDVRMADNPLCLSEPGLRFYAGALLKTESGLPMGTLCVLDYETRELTPLQRDTLRVLARQVMARLELRRALIRADTLRREVDHRVKNSLQSLASLARIQQRSLQTEEARDALGKMGKRIEAITMLHEQLYKSNAGSMIDLSDYVRKLGAHLGASAPPNVTVVVDARDVSVNSRQAGSLGVLINEFAANSFKHAFPDGETGEVRFSLTSQRDSKVVLICSDNGVGMDPDAAREKSGLGMRIAEAITSQLGGELVYDTRGKGVEAIVSFAPAPE